MDTKIVRRFMMCEVYEEYGYRGPYIDRTCDEVNYTALAEAAANEFNLYEGSDFEIPEEVFELAIQVGERIEKELRRR